MNTKTKIVFLVFLLFAASCSSKALSKTDHNNIQETLPTIIPTNTVVATVVEIPAPTPQATLPALVSKFSILDEATKQLFMEIGIPVGNKSVGSYFPIKELGNWAFKDNFGQEFVISNVQKGNQYTTFNLDIVKISSYEVDITNNTIVMLLIDTPDGYLYNLLYAPTINEFVACSNTSGEFCTYVPSFISLYISTDEKEMTEAFDKEDPEWCIKNAMRDESQETTDYYTQPGDNTVYIWEAGKCPEVKIVKIQ